MRLRAWCSAVIVIAVGACSASPSGESSSTSAPAPSTTVALPTGPPAEFDVHGSVQQVWLTGAPATTELALHGSAGEVARVATDSEGSLIFRNLAPGDYVVSAGEGADRSVSETVTVTDADSPPAADFYTAQQLEIGEGNRGYGYLETRDGTLLAYSVTLPGPPDEGPYPTVVEYSGYSPADPQSPQPSTLMMQTLGYATVGVNIRGTGCSGGAFQFFEPLQGTDGYDAIEVVAAQPWVEHGKVGMVGLSYPAIAQLFVAQYQPPHLAAIAPLSPIGDTYRSTLYPGGIFNSGFAKDWSDERQREAEPFGQGWAARRRDEGDQTCIDNQALRGQNPNLSELIDIVDFYEADRPVSNDYHWYANLDPLAPAAFADRINVPVFLAGSWQDEQVGGHFATMLGNFENAPVTRFTLVNGNHTEPFMPQIMSQWFEFIEIYVAQDVPDMPAGFAALAPQVIGAGTWGPAVPFGEARFDAATESYEDVKAEWESEPPVRVLFENGAGCPELEIGAPCPTFEAGFSAWPIPEAEALALEFDADGTLVETATAEGSDSFRYTGDGQAAMFDGSTSELWHGLPELDWTQPAAGDAVAYESEPLDETTVMIGSGSVDLWIAANQADVDLEVTLTEIRGDGTEYYVQGGWLRASHAALDTEASTELRPVQSHREADARPLSGSLDDFVPVRVELFPFGHVFHAGSRIRIVIDAPGNSRPHWKFDIVPPEGDDARVVVARGGATSSRVVLPVVSGVGAKAPADPPPCPSLRGQPCRPYQPVRNDTA